MRNQRSRYTIVSDRIVRTPKSTHERSGEAIRGRRILQESDSESDEEEFEQDNTTPTGTEHSELVSSPIESSTPMTEATPDEDGESVEPEVSESNSEEDKGNPEEVHNTVNDGSAEEDVADTRVTEETKVTEESNFKPNWGPITTKCVKTNKDVIDLKKNDIIRYRVDSESDWEVATVSSRAGKQSGKHHNEFNLCSVDDGQQFSLNLGTVEVEKDLKKPATNTEPSTEQSILYLEDTCSSVFSVNVPKERFKEPGIVKAMETEMKSWKKFKVYHEVRDSGQGTLSTRWVVTDKGQNAPPGQQFKARLVVRG